MSYLFQTGRRQIIILMMVMGLLSLGLFWTVMFRMYLKQKNQQIVFLNYVTNTAKSMIESIGNEEMNLRHVVLRDKLFEQIHYHMSVTNDSTKHLGETGELVIAYFDGKYVSYVSNVRFIKDSQSNQYRIDDRHIGEAMRFALTGNSGFLTERDYRGVTVLSDYQALPQLKIGIVGKFDLTEIQKPFLQGMAYSFLLIVFLFGAAGLIIVRIGERILIINEIREQKYRAYVNHAPIGIIVCDQHGKFLEINETASEIMGYTNEELLSSSFHDVMPNKVLKIQGADSIIHEMVEFFNTDQKFINVKGEEYYLMISVVRLSHERYLSFITDITVRKEMEIRLLESENKFRGLYMSAMDAIVLADDQGRIVLWNLAAEKTFGYSIDEVLIKKISDLIIPQKDILSHEKAYTEFSHTGTGKLIGSNTQLIALRKDKKEIPVEMTLASINLNQKWHAIAIIRDITDRMQAEETLRKSKDLLQSVMEHTPLRIFWKDCDLRYLGCNIEFAKDAGYSLPTELIGKTDFEMAWTEQADLYRADDKATMESGISKLNYIEPQTTPEGKTIWLRTSKVPLRDEKQKIIGILGIYEDITERKQAEEAIIYSEKRYRELFENMLEGYAYCKMIFDNGLPIDFIYINVNSAFEKITGLKDVAGKNVSAIIPGIRESNPELFEIYGKVSLSGQPERFETYVDSLGIWFSITVYSPLKYYFVAMFDDITKQKYLQKELKQSEAKFRTLYESSNDAIMLLDDGKFFDCNARTLQIFGCNERRDFINKGPSNFSPITQQDGQYSENLVKEYIDKAFKNNSYQFEWTHTRFNGGEFFAEVLLTAMELDGRPILQATVRDITERKQMEAQLLQSAKMATLGEMATGIAHEINQPLTVIKMGAQLLERSIRAKNLSEDFLRDQLGKFSRNIDRATKIINHLRLFGRKVSEQMAPYDLNVSIANAIDMVENRLRDSVIGLNLKLEENLPNVLGEESSMEQVIINILLNAVDALMSQGTDNKEIKIITKYEESHEKVVVFISNNGPKIPEVIMRKIFEPFFTTKAPGHGTGLGLSISYGIVQSHGGSITVENTDYGPLFIITLKVELEARKFD